MQYFDWDEHKNEKLKEERGISFEEVKLAIEEGKTLDSFSHPNKKRYPNQYIMIVEINEYAYVVPYVKEGEEKIFLKTAIPSRKATKQYIKIKKI